MDQSINIILQQIIKDKKYKESGLLQLRDAINSIISSEISSDALLKFINELNRKIFELIHGNDSEEKKCGIFVIIELIDLDTEDNTVKLTRFCNYLRMVLPSNDIQVMEYAAKAMGKLSSPSIGGSLAVELVEFEVKRSLEWLLNDKTEFKRYAAVLLIKEIALNASTILYGYMSQILEFIWIPLRDTRPNVRKVASESFAVCLSLIQQRDSQQREQWYKHIYSQILQGFKFNSPEYIHASFLAMQTMIRFSREFMQSNFDECQLNLYKFRDNKDQAVKDTILQTLPYLASNFTPSMSKIIGEWMEFLLSPSRKERDRPKALLCSCELACYLNLECKNYIPEIIKQLKDLFHSKMRKSCLDDIFTCISLCSRALPAELSPFIPELIAMIFSSGLSFQMRQTLEDLATNVSSFSNVIQERLLNLLSQVLTGHSYRPSFLSKNKVYEPKDPDLIILALETLCSFQISGQSLADFLVEAVIPYLDFDNSNIRSAAAKTICAIMYRDPIKNTKNQFSFDLVYEILVRLTTIAISDPDYKIRLLIMKSLASESSVDFVLCQSELIRALFLAINDEYYLVRLNAITIVGRLSSLNPAYVMPCIRKILFQLLSELEFSKVSKIKEESAKLLCALVISIKEYIRPYVDSIFRVLLPKVKDSSSSVSSQILVAIGEVSIFAKDDEIVPFLTSLMTTLTETLQDQSSVRKREAALRSMRLLVSSTSNAIQPYLDYPNLMDTLLDILKTEQSPSIRKETMRLIGNLGALAPYTFKNIQRINLEGTSKKEDLDPENLVYLGIIPSNDDYYPTVAIYALMKILRDQSLNIHHTAVIQATLYMFKTLGLKCVVYLNQIMPLFLNIVGNCSSSLLEFYLQQLGLLIKIVKQHIRPFLVDLFNLIDSLSGNHIQIVYLSLLENISYALDGEFKSYIPQITPFINTLLDANITNSNVVLKALDTLCIFGSSLEAYFHLILPSLLKLLESSNDLLISRVISTIGSLSRLIDFSNVTSRIIQPFVRLLSTNSFINEILPVLTSMAIQLQFDYLPFTSLINKQLLQLDQSLINKDLLSKYKSIVSLLVNNEPLPVDLIGEMALVNSSNAVESIVVSKLPVNQQQLKKTWEASLQSTPEDWLEWLRRLSVELLKESPSHALRACSSLASVYPPISRELFNAAFLSCWSELYDQFQDELVKSIETALLSPQIPPEVLQSLLNLAEFMEHDDKPLPIDLRTLGSYANRCHAYAKALHYKELEFATNPSSNVIESLIAINNQLDQPEVSLGLLQTAKQHDISMKESWYEKLGKFEDALRVYEEKQILEPNSIEITLGRLRCLSALSEWETISTISKEKWSSVTSNREKLLIAPFSASASFQLGDWDMLKIYVDILQDHSPDSSFFKSILAIHENDYQLALSLIDTTRSILDTELTALVGESYERAYSVAVRVQMLTELEEVIVIKQTNKSDLITKTWHKRLHGMQRHVQVWQKILKVRSLVISPSDELDTWLKFCSLCCHQNPKLALKTLSMLFGFDPSSTPINIILESDPMIVYAYIKYLWNTDQTSSSLSLLVQLTGVLESGTNNNASLGITKIADSNLTSLSTSGIESANKGVYGAGITHGTRNLLAKCHYKIGQYKSLSNEATEESIQSILKSYLLAIQYDVNYYKVWHNLAITNYEAITMVEKKYNKILPNTMTLYIIPSLQAFFKSISITHGQSFQDTLRLLTLWFKYGEFKEISNCIQEGIDNVPVETWLSVIPQLIARIGFSGSQGVSLLVSVILNKIASEHPQALIYNLAVATKSASPSRKQGATLIINSIKINNPNLVEQAILVSEELIRVAILLHESWHHGLEEASRLFFGENDPQGMLAVLIPLHELMDSKQPETIKEEAFHQQFYRDLKEAHTLCMQYLESNDKNDLNQAWELYFSVFRKINKQLPLMQQLELQSCSPKLYMLRDSELAIPGTYSSNNSIIRIWKLLPTMQVITSKQRPRKMTIMGSDGLEYPFLLKGHEDLRQDERVMQLFQLINNLLQQHQESFKKSLNIQRYSVIPLSPNSGLLSWVPNCDTLHSLIRDYRESRKILLNIEHRLMLQQAPGYDNLTLIQKMEVFEYSLQNTQASDLYKVLWLKSKNSEVWLDRRSNYTRSLALMSMVGYILGLGDRHPSNLMLDRYTGKIVHIDFGDCFEVAMNRDKFPEKIPFRLTRMMVNAMEVSGIEGSFRSTCESVMVVLRKNKDSMLAVLEAFVYDPLINWRLMAPEQPPLSRTTTIEEIPNELGKSYSKSIARSNRIYMKDDHNTEFINDRAVAVINRVQNKLSGRDFKHDKVLDAANQVDKLIQQATSIENLCQLYVGWCAFW
eukprot:NODE_15_length_42055_cov_0.634117.p1 type:complete len:2332 gc:universal NODE_15_length_42055_cov_0.634117:8372-15367(+)